MSLECKLSVPQEEFVFPKVRKFFDDPPVKLDAPRNVVIYPHPEWKEGLNVGERGIACIFFPVHNLNQRSCLVGDDGGGRDDGGKGEFVGFQKNVESVEELDANNAALKFDDILEAFPKVLDEEVGYKELPRPGGQLWRSYPRIALPDEAFI